MTRVNTLTEDFRPMPANRVHASNYMPAVLTELGRNAARIDLGAFTRNGVASRMDGA